MISAYISICPFIFIILLFHSTDSATRACFFFQTGSTAKLAYVDVNPCKGVPCMLKRGQNYTITVDFTPSTFLKLKVDYNRYPCTFYKYH